ncbi:HNH endonuclease [Candidatus Dojkabacteria bacterium]|jgi:RNase P subunit RPR2|nr:HNH endonuclease [Candidatus Dojkabacteria bacterium]
MKKTKHSKGYVLIYKPEHPRATCQGYVPEHRLVMEKHIGRLVNTTTEEVHHIDEDVTNNKLSNLQLVTRREHRRIHAGWWKVGDTWWKKCNTCKRELVVEGNFHIRHSPASHNECVSECKDCLNRKGREKPRLSIQCPDCREVRLVKLNSSRPAERCRKCAAIKDWKTRRRIRQF